MELFLFFFFSTSNFCYAILNTTLYIITSTSSSGQYQVPQQQVVVGNAVVGSTVLSLQLEQVLVGSGRYQKVVVGSSRYGTGSSRQWQERTRGTQQIRSRQQYKYCSTSSITTYQRTTVDTKSMIRTYVVQYVHSQQREKNEFNAGRRIQR